MQCNGTSKSFQWICFPFTLEDFFYNVEGLEIHTYLFLFLLVQVQVPYEAPRVKDIIPKSYVTCNTHLGRFAP